MHGILVWNGRVASPAPAATRPEPETPWQVDVDGQARRLRRLDRLELERRVVGGDRPYDDFAAPTRSNPT